MEVETRAPIGPPPRPFSEGPSYSPITPERGTTPEDASLQQNINGASRQVGAVGNGAEGQGNAPAAADVLSIEEKLRLGGDDLQKMDIDGPGLTLSGVDVANMLAGSIHPIPDVDPFPQGNPAFQSMPSQGVEDTDLAMPPLLDESDSEPNRIFAFAKLEFEDGQFYMNTYAIEIGRDRDAAREAERKKLREKDRKESEGRSRDGSIPDLERAQKHPEPGLSAAASVVSGGIMHMGDGDERGKKKKKRSKSVESSNEGPSLRETTRQNGKTDYQALANASLLDRHQARPVDLTNMMPSPDECPLIPIHPPPDTESGLTGYKGISRKHVRIAYNHEKGLFELHVLGKNGCFIEGAHIEQGEVIALASGSEIQIGGVSMRFLLPNVPDGETGTDLKSDAVSQSAMSFDFEDGRGESAIGEQDSESPTTDNEDDRYRELRLAQKAEALLSDEDEDLEDDEDEPEVDVRKPRPKIMLKISSKSKSKPATEEEPPPKRKVGRPPKNGIMSKREEAELRRKEKEAAKAKAKEKKAKKTVEAPAEPIVKMEEEEIEDAPKPADDRRKGKKTKPSETVDESSVILESIEKEPSQTPYVEQPPQDLVAAQVQAPKPPKKERPVKPPRSPSPQFNEAELTEEQLAKPTTSYVVLIHEALSNHPEGRMSLPQIYRAIERRYPYYKLRVQTVGWQSSVRHNLSQHPAFVKIERDGKGWMWGLDPAVSIEREKKRRPSPPQMQASGWTTPNANGFNRNFPPNVYAGSNGQMPQNPYAMFPNGPPPPGRGFPSANSLPRPPYSPQQQVPGQPATYQSPYGQNRAPGQNPADNGQAPQQPSGQAVPQMPAPYLNQKTPPGLQNQATQPTQPAGPTSQTQASPAAPTPRPIQAPMSQAPRPQGQPSPAFSPPPNNPHGVPAPMWGLIERFRSALKPAMSSIPDGEAMVNQAINKCIGLPPPANQPYKEFAKENSVLMPLKGMLNKFSWPVEGMIAFAEGKRPDRPPAPSPAPAPPPSQSPTSRPASAQSPVSRAGPVSGGVARAPPPPLPPQYQAPQRHVPMPQSTQQQPRPPMTAPGATPRPGAAAGGSTSNPSASTNASQGRPTLNTAQEANTSTTNGSGHAPTPVGQTQTAASTMSQAQPSTASQQSRPQVQVQGQAQVSNTSVSRPNPSSAPLQDANLKRPRTNEGAPIETTAPTASTNSPTAEPPAKRIAQ